MKRKHAEIKVNKEEEKVKAEKPKKEFKIEIVKVGKLDENTAGAPPCVCGYDCEPSDRNIKENFAL